jgi:hypothetical protein
MPKIIYKADLGLYGEPGSGFSIHGGLNVTRNTTLSTAPVAVSETSGSLLQLKGRAEGVHFHIGGNQYVSNNAWFDANNPEGVWGQWVYETNSAAFRWGFRASAGAFDLDWAQSGVAGKVVTGSNNAVWGTGLSMSASNGAIGLGKKANAGLSATFDITGSSPIALSVTGSVDVGGGKPDSYFLLPRLTTGQRDNLDAQNGMVIYNTTVPAFQGYQAGSWQNLI